MQKRGGIDFWVGLFVLAGFAALLFLVLKAGNMGVLTNSGTYAVQAKFDNIGGLKVRAPVKSAGVVIGRVGDIRFDPKNFQAVVILNIDSRYQFPRDTSAKILTSGLLGEQYVGFEAGGDESNWVDGSVVQSTQSAVVLESLISQFLYNKAADTSAAEK